jgi:YD repeat-containing protein
VYDEAGNLLEKTDAKSITVQYAYDSLNRITEAAFPDSGNDITYTYDEGANGKGHLTSMSDPADIMRFIYDSRGRLSEKTTTISGIDYTVIQDFTVGSRVSSVTYPGTGRTVSYGRDILGKISEVSTTLEPTTTILVDNLSYRPFGGPSGMDTGAGGSIQNKSGECDCLEESNPSGPRTRSYGYDNNRNLTEVRTFNNAVSTPWYDLDFTYDALNRL